MSTKLAHITLRDLFDAYVESQEKEIETEIYRRIAQLESTLPPPIMDMAQQRVMIAVEGEP